MAALAEAGHHATYQSTKEPGFKKALKQPADLVLAAGGDGTIGKVAFRLIDSGIPLSVFLWAQRITSRERLGLSLLPRKSSQDLKAERNRSLTWDLPPARGANDIFLKASAAACSQITSGLQRKKRKRTARLKNFPKNNRWRAMAPCCVECCTTIRSRQWKIEIDGKDISGPYILWEAMNIRSVGPALYFAPRAATRDGRFDFVCARAADRALLMEHFDARVAGKKSNSPLPTRRFRKLRIVWKGSTIHLDDQLWRDKKKNDKSPDEIKITVKPSALIILQPSATIKT